MKHSDLDLVRQGKKMLQRLADQQAAPSSDPSPAG
jgi:hypothetical protein